MKNYDIIIVGGGMIGASLALALGNTRYQVALIEAVPVAGSAIAPQPSFNERMTATSPSSKAFFTALDCWDDLASAAATIQRIHVSTEGRFGTTQLAAADLGVPALGYNVENSRYGHVLFERLAAFPNVTVYCPAKLTDLTIEDAQATLTIDVEAGNATRDATCGVDAGTERLQAKLVVAADGARSTVRSILGIDADIHDYQQSAIVTAVSSKRLHQGQAFERFTSAGPLALLPADDEQRSTVVFTVNRDVLEHHLELSDDDFLALLQQRFGWRLGRLQNIGKRLSYPLYRVLAKETVRPRCVVIGNAAHNLHPVAGQGFNLGLRDVAALAELLVANADDGSGQDVDPGQLHLLNEYAVGRERDQTRFAQLTHGLDKVFANDNAALSAVRGLGLSVFDMLPAAKRRFLQANLGQDANAPKLSRGIAL